MFPKGAFKKRRPDTRDIEEHTGNEGATIELTYHSGVIVIWPKCSELRLIGQLDYDDAIKHLFAVAERCKQESKKKESEDDQESIKDRRE